MTNMSEQTNTHICGYNVTIDRSTSLPLHYASLILKYTVPKDFVWNQNLQKIIEFDNVRLSYGEKATREETIRHAGSSVEGLTVPKFHSDHVQYNFVEPDIDKLLLQCNTFYFHLPYEHAEYASGQMFEVRPAENATANYAYLVPTEQFKRARELDGTPLQTKLVPSSYFKETLFDTLEKYGAKLSLHGPAVTTEMYSAEIDNVPVFAFPYWPPVARDFAERTRRSGWPSQKMLQSILRTGFYLAGVGRRGSEMEDFEWRYSFNTADKMLAHSFTKQQRQVYVYLKLLRMFYLKHPAGFPSFWMKTLFVWICEKVSPVQFSSQNLATILLYIFDEIIHMLSTKHLSNYYIPSVNMLATTPRDHLSTILKQVRYVKSHLIGCLMTIDEKINFVQMTRMSHEKISHLFSHCIQATRDSPADTQLFQSTATTGLKNLLGYYLHHCKELEIFTEEMVLVGDAMRNTYVELIREVLADLRGFCKCGSPDTIDLVHVLEQNKDPNVAAKVLVLLEIEGNISRLELTKRNLSMRIESIAGSSVVKTQTSADVIAAIMALNKTDLKHFENEVLYKLISIHSFDTAPVDISLKSACRQM